MNLLEGRLERMAGGLVCRVGTAVIELGDRPELGRFAGATIGVGMRPEHVRVVDAGGVEATVVGNEYLGSDTLVACEVNDAASVSAPDPAFTASLTMMSESDCVVVSVTPLPLADSTLRVSSD